MGSTAFGNFYGFCQEATLPVCNLFDPSIIKGGNNFDATCTLTGIPLSGDRYLRNLGSIILCGFAVLISFGLLFLSERKKAAVGRREMQLFLLGYMVISICEIFTVGGIPSLPEKVVLGFTAVHLAAIAATTWILMLNGIVGYQLLDDGTAMSILLVLGSAAAIFIGTGYIALDTGFSFTGYFNSSLSPPDRNIGLYVLYWLLPLICLVFYFALETLLVLRVLGERKPMIYLLVAAVLFALGQIFQFTISKYICSGTSGRIDGALFETLFTLLAVISVWTFWSSITEDDWPVQETSTGTPYG